MVMLYLMVGGPWHGVWKDIRPGLLSHDWLVHVPDPPQKPVFEKALFKETGNDLDFRSHSYYLHRFESRPITNEGNWDAYLDALVSTDVIGYRGEVMMDALNAAIYPFYDPIYDHARMSKRGNER